MSSPSFSSFRENGTAEAYLPRPSRARGGGVVDAEVVGDLVDHGDAHLLTTSASSAHMARIGRRKIVMRSGITIAVVAGVALGQRDRRRRGRAARTPSAPVLARPRPRCPSAGRAPRGCSSRASATSSSKRSRATSTTPAAYEPLGSLPSPRWIPRRCSRGSTTPSARAVTSTAHAARRPRPGRVGQDPGAHPPHRLPGGHRRRRPPARAGPHLHPQGGRRARPTGSAASACAATPPPAPSTPWPGARCAPAGPTRAAPRPTLLDRKGRVLARAGSAGPGQGRALAWPATSPPRSSGPRPAWSRPTTTPRRSRAAGAASRRSSPSWWPRATAPTSSTSSAAGWSTSTTCSRCAPEPSRRTSASPPPSAGGTATSSSTSSRT